MKLFKFKKKKNINYQCVLIKNNIIGIISEKLREEHLVKYKQDMFMKEPKLLCILKLDDIPITKDEKKVLTNIGCLYYYAIHDKNNPTKYNYLLEKFTKNNKNL